MPYDERGLLVPDLPTSTRLSPIRDDHAWYFPDINGYDKVIARLQSGLE
ncbi:hypothetical protein [Streptosporangium sp. CA-115845]